MSPLIEHHLPALRTICRRHAVERLDVFGSAAGGGFDPHRSDVDFVVRFRPGTDLGRWLGKYFDLRAEFEGVLGRPVELVMESAMVDPLFLREADRSRQLVYAAEDAEAA